MSAPFFPLRALLAHLARVLEKQVNTAEAVQGATGRRGSVEAVPGGGRGSPLPLPCPRVAAGRPLEPEMLQQQLHGLGS